MKTTSSPSGNVLKRLLLSLFVFIGMSVSLYADTFTQSDLNGTKYNVAYINEHNQTILETIDFNDQGNGVYKEDIVSSDGNLTEVEDGNFSWMLNIDGTLSLSWQDSQCSGTETYTLLERNTTVNGTATLKISATGTETCIDGNFTDSFTDVWHMVDVNNWNTAHNIAQATADAIESAGNYDPSMDQNTTTPMISETDLLGSWEIYRTTTAGEDYFGCAEIQTGGVELVHLAANYGGNTLTNGWTLNGNVMDITIPEHNASQTATFNSISPNEVNVTCTFDNNWFMGLSSEPRRLVKVTSCTSATDGNETNTTTPTMRIEVEKITIDATQNLIHNEELNITTMTFSSYEDDNFTIGGDSGYKIIVDSDEPFALKYIGEVNASDLNATLFTNNEKAYQFAVKDTWTEYNGTVVTEYFEVNLFDLAGYNTLAALLTNGDKIEPFEKEISEATYSSTAAQDFSAIRGIDMYGYWLEGDDDNYPTTQTCGENQYWDSATNQCVYGSDGTSTEDGDLRIEQIVFSADGTAQNFKYDGTSFVDDGNETYSIDGSNVITLVTDEGNESVKYNGTTTIVDLPVGLTAHEFCIQENRTDGIKYFKGTLLEGNETILWSLKELNFDLMKLGMDINETEYQACVANDLTEIYDTPLYMLEKDDDRTDGPSDDWQMSFPYQVVGNITLPALGDDVHNVWMSAQPLVGYNWNGTNIDKNEGNNSYVLGLNDGKYILRLELHKDGGFEEYIYDKNTTSWFPQQQLDFMAVDENGNEVLPEDQQPYMNYNFVPKVTPVDTADFNTSGQTEINFNLAALYDSFFVIEGNITIGSNFTAAEYCMSNSMSGTEICEWNQDGVQGYNNWVGANRINLEIRDAQNGESLGWFDVKGSSADNGDGTKTYPFSIKVSKDGNYTIKVTKESFDPTSTDMNSKWESFFFNPQTGKLVDEMNVQWTESDQTDNWGNKMWLPDSTTTGVLEVADVEGNKTASFGEINFATFASTQIKLNGTITFDDADYINIELINAATGNWFGWTEVQNSGDDFNITLPSGEGEYIIRVSKVNDWNWESYYYNTQTNKFVIDQNINWVENPNGMWVPDTNQTGKYVVTEKDGVDGITQADVIPPVTIDFTALDSQFYTLSGKVTVPSTFTAGEVKDANDNWLGWNNVNFDVMDASNGNWIGWFEIDRDSNATDTSGNKTYDYKIKLKDSGEYIVQVRLESYTDGVNEYEGYYLNFQEGTLVSDKKVMHIPVLDGMTPNGKASNECWDAGNFWWQEPGTSEGNGSCYDSHPNQWLPNKEETGSLVLTDDNKSATRDINFVSLADSVYKFEGTIVVPAGFVPNHDWQNHAMIRVEAIDAITGMWLGDGHISDIPVAGTSNEYKYSFKLSDVTSGDNIIVKLVKEEQDGDNWNWDAYFVNFGDDHNSSGTSTLVAENTVEWVESNTTDDWGNTMWLPDASQTGYITLGENKLISLDIDYDAMLLDYENNKLSISGKIILPEAVTLGDNGAYWNNIRVEAIDKLTGEWVTSRDVDFTSETTNEFNYELEFSTAKEYIIKVTMELNGIWEEYYVNFGDDNAANGTSTAADKIVNGQKVQWTEAQEQSNWGGKNWMPNPAQSGYIDLAAKVEDYDIDFNAFESSIAKISGSITVSDDFEAGDKFDSNGNWIGYSNIRVEAISKTTGEWIASTNVAQKALNSDYYDYELKIGDTDEVGEDFIVRVTKESSLNNKWEFDELFINFGDNHEFDYTDALVNGKRVQWREAESAPSWGGNYKLWMPDFEQTGYITIGDVNPNGVNVDFTTLGQNDIKLSGTVTFKNDFNISLESNGARVAVIDASSGMWVGDASVENNGTYELNLGDASEAAGDYIIQINYWHNDYSNWQDSWWKNKVVDFGTDNAYDTDDVIYNDSDVQWKEIKVSGQEWGMWVPDVNTLAVSQTTTGLDFDLSTTSGGSVNGVITGIPSGAQQPYVMIINPATYANNWIELKEQNNGTYTFNADELKVANYTVEFGYEKDGKYYHFFIKDDNNNTADGVGTVESQEVRWIDLGNNVWGPSTEDTTYVTIVNAETLDLNISLTVVTYNSVTVTLTGTENGKYASADINIPGKPFGRWEQNTTVDTNVSFTFADVKDGNEYILNFWYDNASYTCDGANCESLKKNAMWIAYNTNGAQVCPKANNDWNCDWENSQNWTWKPDVTPITISGDTNLVAALPEERIVSGALSLGSDYANQNVYVSIFQHNGSDHNWADFTLDANGDVNSSMKVAGGSNYRIELWVDGLGGYVYTASGWINQNNSWEEDNTTHMWEPKTSTLIDINANLDLGLVTIGSNLSKVTIILENLDTQNGNIVEDVWVNLESNTNGYYGEGNANWEQTPVTYDGNITLKVPNGTDYRVMVYPSNHKGGYASNNNGEDNNTITQSTKLGWNEKDFMVVSSDTTFTVTLPAANEVGEINGTIVCDENNASADCSGYIESYSQTLGGKSANVNSDGTFSIKGLDVGTYELSYWAMSGLILNKADVAVVANSVTTVSITKDLGNMFESITGTVTAGDLTGVYVVLIETNGTTFEVINETNVDGSGNYSFGAMPKTPNGKALIVAAAKRTANADYSTSTKFDEAKEVYDANGDVGMPTLTTDDFASALTATANEYAQ